MVENNRERWTILEIRVRFFHNYKCGIEVLFSIDRHLKVLNLSTPEEVILLNAIFSDVISLYIRLHVCV